MKLDASDIRYIDEEQWRVLRAVEQGSRNHQVVPTPLITSLAHLHHAGINKLIGNLARRNLVARVQNAAYDGYRLTYGGLDFLALRTFVKNDVVHAVGQQIGVGKESDIYIVTGPSLTDGEPERRILKMHRLGRISFRNVKEKRDYLGKRKTSSWMYLSKLAAAKEIAFMQILHDHGFPVPRPFAQARHCIVMELIDAYPLRQVASIPTAQLGPLYSALMKLIVRLARAGLIHGDFNEFNLLIREIHDNDTNDEYEEGYGPDGPIPKGTPSHNSRPEDQGEEATAAGEGQDKEEDEEDDAEDEDDDDDSDGGEAIYIDEGVRVEPILIDFPQMMSVEHDNAKFYFDRDVACIQRFFRKRFRYTSTDTPPRFEDVVPPSRRVNGTGTAGASQSGADDASAEADVALDALVNATGYGNVSGKRKRRERFVEATTDDQLLEEAMAHVRMQDPQSRWNGSSSGEEDEAGEGGEEDHEDEDGSEGEDEDEEEDKEEGSDGENVQGEGAEAITQVGNLRQEHISARNQHRAAKANKSSVDVATRVAQERNRARNRDAKHHGAKALGSKMGRRHAGGKAKGDLIRDSAVF
ncbi:Serine/threonine-protein kinase rio2 [Tilletia horrida]|uniref:Serine/threonine-protein kinase RIO2 n=1 Tax=Tilletia horrida TaxID=155126 RepID=A0AAN6GMM8_9BASI|nr:Serine/threonine-protein kinase rio2 [Tilletia horrida]KAK0563088.1 Serine/threonine-protein kinase rio2 [Tilletia horrida]